MQLSYSCQSEKFEKGEPDFTSTELFSAEMKFFFPIFFDLPTNDVVIISSKVPLTEIVLTQSANFIA